MAASRTLFTSVLPTSFIELSTKPGANLSYSFIPAHDSTASPTAQPLIVFLNGLGLPASSWTPTISTIQQQASHPALLAYDRYGHGLTTDRDPVDASAPDPAHPHDCMSVVHDLHQLLSQISSKYHLSETISNAGLFFVCNSIGCALARLYAQTYPGSVSALLFLDSVMANSDFVSFWPDPDAPDFKEKFVPLPEGVTEENLRETREKYGRIFHPARGVMGKGEGLSRKNLPDLLPDANAPKLQGIGRKGPWLTVAGHDADTMAEQSLTGMMATPVALTKIYAHPYWHEYNEGLAKLTDADRSKGPIKADGCGHFIQKDDPNFVAREIFELLGKLA